MRFSTVKVTIIALISAFILTGAGNRPGKATEGAAQPTGDRLTVLTFNVWGIVKGKERPARYKAIAKRIAELDPDIISIQEAFTLRHRKLFKKALRNEGYKFRSWKYFRRYYGSGVLFISKFPIDEVEWKPYVVAGAWNDIEWLGGKGIAHLHVLTPWGPLDFFATHAIARMTRMFDDEGKYIPGDYNEIDRHIHMYQIDRVVRKYRDGKGRSIIAAGDFNVSPEMPEYPFLVALTGFESSFEELNPGKNPSTYSEENMWVEYDSSRIDHIFYKNYEGENGFWLKPVVSRVEMDEKFTDPESGLEMNYSDHYGVWTEFEIVNDESGIEFSNPGVGERRPEKVDPKSLAQYVRDGSVVQLTGENARAWRDLALTQYEDAYKSKDRNRPALVPLAEIIVASTGQLPAVMKVRDEYVAGFNELLNGGK